MPTVWAAAAVLAAGLRRAVDEAGAGGAQGFRQIEGGWRVHIASERSGAPTSMPTPAPTPLPTPAPTPAPSVVNCNALQCNATLSADCRKCSFGDTARLVPGTSKQCALVTANVSISIVSTEDVVEDISSGTLLCWDAVTKNSLTVVECPAHMAGCDWTANPFGTICATGERMSAWVSTSAAPIAGHVCSAPANDSAALMISPYGTTCIPNAANTQSANVRVHDITDKAFTDWESAYEWCDALAAKFEVAGTSWTDGTITLMSTSSLMEAHDRNGNSEKSDGQSTTDEAQKNGAAARAHSLSKWQTTPTGQKSILVVCMDWIAGDTTDGAPSGSAQSTDCPTRTSTLMQTVKEEFERMSFNRVTMTYYVLPQNLRFLRTRAAMVEERARRRSSDLFAAGGPFEEMIISTFGGTSSSDSSSLRRRDLPAASSPVGQYVTNPSNALNENLRNLIITNNEYVNPYSPTGTIDLVLVMVPQSYPTGTGGLGWVGYSGSAVNGCELRSDSECVHIIVHELGHNFGLHHASSPTLDYGNIFDYMGNAFKMTGTNFGAGAEINMNWIPTEKVELFQAGYLAPGGDPYNGAHIRPVVLYPYDSSPEPAGNLAMKIRWVTRNANGEAMRNAQGQLIWDPNVLYVQFRNQLTEDHDGVYLVYMNENTKITNMVDCGCHTASMRDAQLKSNWTFFETNSEIFIRVENVTSTQATLSVFRLTTSAVPTARSAVNFTDGSTVCPRTCVDSDYLVNVNVDNGAQTLTSCSQVADAALCNSEQCVNVNGNEQISSLSGLCPVSCGMCGVNFAGVSTLNTCVDTYVRVSNIPDSNGQTGTLNCQGLAAAGYCSTLMPAGVHTQCNTGVAQGVPVRVEHRCAWSCDLDGCRTAAGHAAWQPDASQVTAGTAATVDQGAVIRALVHRSISPTFLCIPFLALLFDH